MSKPKILKQVTLKAKCYAFTSFIGRNQTDSFVLILQHLPYLLVDIKTIGDRILVSDVQESVHFVKYKRSENQLVVFADDTQPR